METTSSFAPRILQFMLRTIGIDSSLVNVYTPLDDVKKIGAVSSDYSVLKTDFDGISFSDISLDIVTSEFNGEPSYDSLFVDLRTINKTNRIVQSSIFVPSKGISPANREKLVRESINSVRCDKRKLSFEMDNINSSVAVEVAKDNIKRFYTLMSSDSVTLSDYLSLKKKIADAKRTINKHSLLKSSSKTLIDQYGSVDVYTNKAYIERTLGISIDPKDRSNREPYSSEDYPLKSYETLLAEKEQLIRQVNREEQIGIIEKAAANKLKSKIEYVYGYFMRNARQEINMDDYLRKFSEQLTAMLETDGDAIRLL
jgi:hypothetical protein